MPCHACQGLKCKSEQRQLTVIQRSTCRLSRTVCCLNYSSTFSCLYLAHDIVYIPRLSRGLTIRTASAFKTDTYLRTVQILLIKHIIAS